MIFNGKKAAKIFKVRIRAIQQKEIDDLVVLLRISNMQGGMATYICCIHIQSHLFDQILYL